MCDFAALPQRLIPWFADNARVLPWRQNRDPYCVWLSEIMLQQTRVEAVKVYYTRFLQTFPTVEDLASASREQVFKLWEGLGYYRRADLLMKAAKAVAEQYGGTFPRTYAELRALPGVGDYTAGAVGSICFELPTPAVDGNVLRVTARFCGSDASVDLPQTKKQVTAQLAAVYPEGRCSDFTQSLMELGATVCVPNGKPLCDRCPLADLCVAYRENRTEELPVRSPKKSRKIEEKTVFLFRYGDRIALRKRPDTGLLAGLWELPNVAGHLSVQEATDLAVTWGMIPVGGCAVMERTHIFTHVEWRMRCYEMACRTVSDTFCMASESDRKTAYPLPTAFRMFTESILEE